MTRHKVNRNEFRLGNGAAVDIEYWVDPTTVHVAAFDTDKRQISTAAFHASVDNPDDLNPQLQQALVDSLANALEYALIRKPDIHVLRR